MPVLAIALAGVIISVMYPRHNPPKVQVHDYVAEERAKNIEAKKNHDKAAESEH